MPYTVGVSFHVYRKIDYALCAFGLSVSVHRYEFDDGTLHYYSSYWGLQLMMAYASSQYSVFFLTILKL